MVLKLLWGLLLRTPAPSPFSAETCAAVFDMQVLYYDLVENRNLEKMGVKKIELDHLFEHSDFLSLHSSLTAESCLL